MARIWAVLLVAVVFLCGCKEKDGGTERALMVRETVLGGNGCSFLAHITADLGDMTYTFSLDCKTDPDGTLFFTVNAPQAISGVTGKIDGQGGRLTFDDQVVAFPLIAQEQISPVCAPYLIYRSLTGGYIRSCGTDERGFRISIDDSFSGDNIRTELWLDQNNCPVFGEVIWQGRRILTVEFEEYQLL